jgi:hypothetical protein
VYSLGVKNKYYSSLLGDFLMKDRSLKERNEKTLFLNFTEEIRVISSPDATPDEKDRAVEKICSMSDITALECAKAINSGVLIGRGVDDKIPHGYGVNPDHKGVISAN